MKKPLVALLLFSACATASDDPAKPPAPEPHKAVADYPLPKGERWTTLTHIWQPTEPSAEAQSAIYDGLVLIEDLAKYGAFGLAEIALGAGEPHVRYQTLATAGTAPTRRSLLYFLQFSDLHITDEESPVRLEGVTRIAFASAYRPQGHLTAQMTDALVRTVNDFSFADRPFDFAFVTGDVADNGQENEVGWVRALLDGDVVTPDSGRIDDPIPGDGNDFTDPFQAGGLDKRVPWYMLFGNHDQMYLGSFDPTPDVVRALLGDRVTDLWGLSNFSNATVTFGARDASRSDAPVIREGARTPADPRRRFVSQREFMAAFLTTTTEPKGHGFTADNVERGFTSYAAHPAKDFPLRLIGIDTVMELKFDKAGQVVQHAGSEGEISRELWDGFVVPELEAAQAAGELVIVASHHCSESIQEGVSEVDRAEIRATLKKYPNVLAHLCGHGHRSRLWFWQAGAGEAHGYPELMQASAVDFPIQARALELVSNGDGTLSLFTTQIEPNVAPGSLAHEGLVYTAAAHNFPPISLLPEYMWYADKPFRNVEILLPVPPGFDAAALPGKGVESLGRLKE